MKRLSTNELRKCYLDFFVAKNHTLVKSDSLVPAHDPSVLFTSAGMNQFKDHFLGKVKDFKRATSCQKCFRTGDLDQVGETPYHHTFFEMLGNFSFGDYFKKEAIAWAWEFVTKVLEIDAASLWISVYEDDEEALSIWKEHIGLPLSKIKKFGAKDNFWPSNAIKDGPNGPCGPCSEIYYQKPNGESVEVWNLVFTQFNRCDGGVLEPLPNKNIDTGMGLERMSSVLQGVDSNFNIDIFLPIIDAVKKSLEGADAKTCSMIADHVRAVTFCICDGVLPSNEGRGYVVRKLIRRCSFLNTAKHPKPFLYKIVSSVADVMSETYPELLERRDNIAQIIKAEEEKYIQIILEGGKQKVDALIEAAKKTKNLEISAEKVADLYTTHGVPVEFSVELITLAGCTTSSGAAYEAIKLESDKSRVSSKIAGSIFGKETVPLKKSEFVGYEVDTCSVKIIQLIKDGQEINQAGVGENIGVVLEKTPFYGESGGQVGDKGVLILKNSDVKIMINDTKKQDGSIIHVGEVHGAGSVKTGDAVDACVDGEHRAAVKRAHSSTHVLQAVLRKALGPHVQQAGSLVEPDRFRFDFTHFKDISDEEFDDIQELLNEYVIKNDALSAKSMSKEDAQKTGAIALFGEKYGDTVRVVSIGDYSKEFCGGTHLDRTGNIGLILITSGSSVGSGLRRIEALTGKLAYQEVFKKLDILEEISKDLKTAPTDILHTLEMKQSRLKVLEKTKTNRDALDLNEQLKESIKNKKVIGKLNFIVEKLDDRDPSLLRNSIDFLKKTVPNDGVFVVSSVFDNNAYFACGSTSEISAHILLQKMLSSFGGSGGGRKDFAQGGIKAIDKVDLVIKEAERLIGENIEEMRA